MKFDALQKRPEMAQVMSARAELLAERDKVLARLNETTQKAAERVEQGPLERAMAILRGEPASQDALAAEREQLQNRLQALEEGISSTDRAMVETQGQLSRDYTLSVLPSAAAVVSGLIDSLLETLEKGQALAQIEAEARELGYQLSAGEMHFVNVVTPLRKSVEQEVRRLSLLRDLLEEMQPNDSLDRKMVSVRILSDVDDLAPGAKAKMPLRRARQLARASRVEVLTD